MLELIDPHGKRVKLYGTHKQIAKSIGLSAASIASLVTGRRMCIKGWLSCHSKMKKRVKDTLDHFTLHNIETEEMAFTWHRTNTFKDETGLRTTQIANIRRGERHIIKKWITKKTYDLLYR